MAQEPGAPRIRRDVQSLIDGTDEDKAVLEAYATAIRKMRALDEPGPGPPTNPLSWRFQAAIHWIEDRGNNPLLKQCQHFNWFFLPWHRIYLYRFERIIQHHLGDDTWALPYWDYTKRLVARTREGTVGDEEARKLPLPFRTPKENNPLFTDQRVAEINDGTPIDDELTDARAALRQFPFTRPPRDAGPSFGGARAGPGEQSAGGLLEDTPHGQVHMQVGGEDLDLKTPDEQSGWMWLFDTAPLDPIFWLHHCNLDRLWEVWVAFQSPDHPNPNPSEDLWLKQKFAFADADGTTKRTSVESVQNTRDLGYEYESIEPPLGLERKAVFFAEGVEVERPSPELVGAATDVPFAEPTTVRIDLEEPLRAAVVAELAGPEEWHLRVENIRGTRPQAMGYAVYLNVEGPRALEEPGIRVGVVSAFGITEMSEPDEQHDGTGITVALEITEGVRALEEKRAWDARHAKVTIVPIGSNFAPAPGGDVRAGRISIYRG